MKTRLIFAHIFLAVLVLTLAKLAPNTSFVLLIVPVLILSWIIARISWDSLDGVFSRIAALVRRIDQDGGPAFEEGDLQGIAVAYNETRNRLMTTLGKLTTEKRTAALILNNMRDGAVLTDTDANVILANPAAGQIFRIDTERIVGRPLVQSIHSQELIELISKVVHEKTEAEDEIDIFTPKDRRLRITALPVNDEDGLSAVLVVFNDITNRHRVEAVRRDFVSNVSHELKTPVAAINLLAESLITSIGSDEKTAKRFAGKLEHQTRLLATLVNDLLDLSQLEAPEIKTLFAPVDVDNLVKEVCAELTEAAGAGGLSLRTELSADLPRANGSEDQLKLMLRNLIDNAIHYTQPGGDVVVKTGQAGKNMLSLVVKDTGLGIPAADAERVFERFYRVDKDRSRETGGTGLGLSIVKHVIDNHSGQIKLESVVGVGSKFTILLPVFEPDKTKDPEGT